MLYPVLRVGKLVQNGFFTRCVSNHDSNTYEYMQASYIHFNLLITIRHSALYGHNLGEHLYAYILRIQNHFTEFLAGTGWIVEALRA